MKHYQFKGTSVTNKNKFLAELKECISYVEEIKDEAGDFEISDFMDKVGYRRILKTMIKYDLIQEVPDHDNKPIL